MTDISEFNINNTSYNLKDTQARSDLNSLSTNVNNNFLPISGGTLTGPLSISTEDYTWSFSTDGQTYLSNALHLKINDINTNTTPESNIYPRVIYFRDENNDDRGHLALFSETNGKQGVMLEAQRNINDTTSYNTLRLEVDSSNNNTVWFSDSAAWINALGGSNGILSTNVGGTGGTDSGWQSLSNSSVFSGTIQYRRIGKFVCVRFWNVKLKSALSSTSALTLTTLPSGYRPHDNYPFRFTSPDAAAADARLIISSNGNLNMYKGSTNITTSHAFHCFCAFMIS